MSKHKIAAGSAFDLAGYQPKVDWKPLSTLRKLSEASSTAVTKGQISIGVECTSRKTTRRTQAELAMQPRKGRKP